MKKELVGQMVKKTQGEINAFEHCWLIMGIVLSSCVSTTSKNTSTLKTVCLMLKAFTHELLKAVAGARHYNDYY